MSTIVSILSLVVWMLVGGVVVFLLLIARFYEIKYAELYDDSSRKRTFYQLYPIPLVLFLVAIVRSVRLGDMVGDVWGDLAFLAGGVILAVLGYRLQRLMTGGWR